MSMACRADAATPLLTPSAGQLRRRCEAAPKFSTPSFATALQVVIRRANSQLSGHRFSLARSNYHLDVLADLPFMNVGNPNFVIEVVRANKTNLGAVWHISDRVWNNFFNPGFECDAAVWFH